MKTPLVVHRTTDRLLQPLEASVVAQLIDDVRSSDALADVDGDGRDEILATGAGTRALDADLVVVGKHDRQSARARARHRLPCGLLNTVGQTLQTPVRTATARRSPNARLYSAVPRSSQWPST